MTETQFQVGLVYRTRFGDEVQATEIGKGVLSGRWLTGARKNKTDMWLVSGEYRGDGGTSPHDLLPGALPTPATDDKAELLAALRASVQLQSHYAVLLNDLDGGQRLTFASAEAWLERLRKVSP